MPLLSCFWNCLVTVESWERQIQGPVAVAELSE